MNNLQRAPIIGVMGGAVVDPEITKMAFELGAVIAQQGWILLSGGRDMGVMRASAEGAKSKGGLTIGILPGDRKEDANPFIDIPIVTNLADGRNVVNVLTSDVVVACPGSAGTISEIALALKNRKQVILLSFPLQQLFADYVSSGQLHFVKTPVECVLKIKELLNKK